MPRMVYNLTEAEEGLRSWFTEEQMCAYFLTKTIRSQYKFDDHFISDWCEEIFDKKPEAIEEARRDLVKAYTDMLMFEKNIDFIWVIG